ncbi:Serine/threonine-protein kinase StkP [Caulifigura coniformis]|uniref:Serine/threonine-protein kinase StkP n=1 Tax=Caulifigura coniformis TaxID=2527983 RepID=A0A517S885_9PLAN|nr:serine/threonine-protein kinase [Caulifigura coniformis]QDT52335.1 Serine/threonine-protein kinase StkP [Caulifigura coniformis]
MSHPPAIGPYRVLRQLGEGGMGVVYLAEDPAGKQLALKVPTPMLLLEPTYVRRLYREALAAAQIDHPGIARIFDVQQDRDRYYLVMAYITGRTLAETLDGGRRYSIPDSLALVSALARIVQVAHDAGIIHRDLKPGNIMLAPDGEPIVMDFGMARSINATDSLLTPTGAVAGTPGYMAPEQITADPADIGPACDIYALGVLLYELLTNSVPFSGNLATLLGSIVADPPTPLRRHLPDLPPALESACLKAMEKEPAKRYRSALEFAQTLDSLNAPA